VTQHSYVDYTWVGRAEASVDVPIDPRVNTFARASGRLFGVDPLLAKRDRQLGAAIEAGVRIRGGAGAIELFAGFERRVDADPLDRQPQRWALAGFRLVGR